MIKINIHEAKTHLSRYIDRLIKGEIIILCKRNIPIAEIHSIMHKSKVQRPIGLAKDKFKIPPEFYESLPSEIVDSFYGEGK